MELLSWLLQFRDINSLAFFSRRGQDGRGREILRANPVLVTRTREDSGRGARGRWSYLGLDKRLFIQRGRKLIRDATSLHFLSARVSRTRFLKGTWRPAPRAHVNMRKQV